MRCSKNSGRKKYDTRVICRTSSRYFKRICIITSKICGSGAKMKTKIRCHLIPLQRSKKFRLPQCKQLPFFYPDPPNKGSGKSGSCYWAGGWRVVKNKACQKSEKCKNPQAPSQVKKFIFSFFLQGNIRSISPEKMKIIFSEQGARPK